MKKTTKSRPAATAAGLKVSHDHAAIYRKGDAPVEYWFDIGDQSGISWANAAARSDLKAWHRVAEWAATRGFERDNFPLPDGAWDHADDFPDDDDVPDARAAFAEGFFGGVRHIVRLANRERKE